MHNAHLKTRNSIICIIFAGISSVAFRLFNTRMIESSRVCMRVLLSLFKYTLGFLFTCTRQGLYAIAVQPEQRATKNSQRTSFALALSLSSSGGKWREKESERDFSNSKQNNTFLFVPFYSTLFFLLLSFSLISYRPSLLRSLIMVSFHLHKNTRTRTYTRSVQLTVQPYYFFLMSAWLNISNSTQMDNVLFSISPPLSLRSHSLVVCS